MDARRFKEPLPDRIANKPNLFFGLALFYNAWYELDAERDRPKRITRSMCFQYADDYDFEEEQREDLWYFVSRMDIPFLEWWKKKQPKTRNPKGGRRGANSQRSFEEDAGAG